VPYNTFAKTCPHCGAVDTRRLGDCVVCEHVVCEHCGSVQFSQGERRVTHKECLKRDEGAFKMIKFRR
jgi:hypothetical protein